MKKNILIWVIVALIMCGCASEKEDNAASNDFGTILKGVSLSPKSFEEKDFLEFIEEVDRTQDLLLWAGDWIELYEESAPITVSDLANVYDFLPVIEVGHYIQETGELIRPLNSENRQIYKNSTIKYIEEYKPAYFGIGVEVNIFAEKNPQDFENFVIFYNEIYELIKETSPNTKIFTVYQLEKMKGLNFWGAEVNEPQWEMINKFKSDIVAFTTYPGLVYKDPADIPEDHYTEILLYTDKQIAFMEIGWHSAPSPFGWESSEEEQKEFLERFFILIQECDVNIAIWSFMYDSDRIEPFNSMGLFRIDGTQKSGWNIWLQLE